MTYQGGRLQVSVEIGTGGSQSFGLVARGGRLGGWRTWPGEWIGVRGVSELQVRAGSLRQLAAHLGFPVKPPADHLRQLHRCGGSPSGRSRELG